MYHTGLHHNRCTTCGGAVCDKQFPGSAPFCCQREVRAAKRPCGAAPCIAAQAPGEPLSCSPGQTPCGRASTHFSFIGNNVCCATDQFCKLQLDDGVQSTACIQRFSCGAGQTPCGSITAQGSSFDNNKCCDDSSQTCKNQVSSGGSGSACFPKTSPFSCGD
eukprot:9604-Heterococcus_DN1.PRE.1